MSNYKDGLVVFEQAKFAKAAALFSAAIVEGDNVPNAHSKRGVCFLRLGDAQAAERDFRAALVLDERCTSAMVNLGNLMLERGQLDEAQLHYQQALRIDETYAFAHHNLGVLYRRRGNLAASIRELRLAARYEARPETTRKRLSWWKRR